MKRDMRPILAEKRLCFNCGKRIPNHRQKRAKTCSVQCSNYYNRRSGNWRIENSQRLIKNA